MVLSVTSGAGLSRSAERISTVLAGLDEMLGGHASTGRTTLSTLVADAACARGAHVLFVPIGESPGQVVRT